MTAGARSAARALAPLPLPPCLPRLRGRAPRPPPGHGPRAPPLWHAPAPGTRGPTRAGTLTLRRPVSPHSHWPRAGTHPPPAGTLARTGTRGPLAVALPRERPPDGRGPRASRAALTAGLKNARAPTPTPTPRDPPGPLGAHSTSPGSLIHTHSLTQPRPGLRCAHSHTFRPRLPRTDRLPGIPRANSRGPPAGISVRRRRARAPRPHFGQGRPAVSVPPVVLPPPAVTPPPSHRHSHPLSGGKGAICPRDPGWTRLGTKTLTSHQVSSDTPLLPCPSSPPPSAPDPRPRERPPPGLRGVGRVRPLCLDGQCQSARARVWRWRFAPRAFLFAAWAFEGRVCSLHSPPGLRSGDNMGD